MGYTYDEFWAKLVEAKVLPEDLQNFYASSQDKDIIPDEDNKYL